MTYQTTFEVRTSGRGTLDVTTEVARAVRAAQTLCGIAHVFVQHTSCSVLITENADADVRRDQRDVSQTISSKCFGSAGLVR